MIIVNDVKLNTLPGTDAFVKHYKECIRELEKRFGKSILLDHPIEAATWTDMGKGKRRAEWPASKEFSTKQIYLWQGRQYEVVYATNYIPGKKTNEPGFYVPKTYDFRGKTSINLQSNPDLAFFLVFVSPYCGYLKQKDLAKNQNQMRGKRRHYVVYDEYGNAEEELETNSRVAEAQAFISSEKFSIPLDKIIDLCIVYGLLSPTEEIKEPIIRKKLSDFVLMKDAKGKYKMDVINQFIADVEYPEMIAIKALVKELLANNVVSEHRENKKTTYVVVDEMGKVLSEICPVNKFDIHENSLVNYLQDHYEDVKDLRELLEKRKKLVLV